MTGADVTRTLDDTAHTLPRTVPEGMPFSARTHVATMRVTDDAGRGRLSWSRVFGPEERADADAVAEGLRSNFDRPIHRIEAHVQAGQQEASARLETEETSG
jgi:hypothetical protein